MIRLLVAAWLTVLLVAGMVMVIRYALRQSTLPLDDHDDSFQTKAGGDVR